MTDPAENSGRPAKLPVLSIGISMTTLQDAADTVSGWIAADERRRVHVCTTHTVLECHDHPELARAVNEAALALPDGMPLVWLGRLHGCRVGRVYGPDLMLELCRRGVERRYRHFLYGSTPETLGRLQARLEARFPGIVIAGTHAPPFRELTEEEKESVVRQINDARPHIVWVGLGAPKQDVWAIEFRERLTAPVLIPVGAAFAFHAGDVPQAPRWMMRCGLEWFYRLLREPGRLWRRYLIGNPRFVFLVCMQLLRLRRYDCRPRDPQQPPPPVQ